MAHFKRFSPPKEQLHCLWCGEKLRKHNEWNPKTDRVEFLGNYGGYGDNFFCSMRCGYQFGKAFAGFGNRLQRKQK